MSHGRFSYHCQLIYFIMVKLVSLCFPLHIFVLHFLGLMLFTLWATVLQECEYGCKSVNRILLIVYPMFLKCLLCDIAGSSLWMET